MSSTARYGIVLDASLITGIDPPPDVESALAAINTAHNPSAPRSRWPRPPPTRSSCSRAAPSRSRPSTPRPRSSRWCSSPQQLADLKKNGGSGVLNAYVRNVKLALFSKAKNAFVEVKP